MILTVLPLFIRRDLETSQPICQNCIIDTFGTLLLVTFKQIKKAYLQTLKVLPIPQTFPMTSFILKNNYVKKGYLQIPNIFMTPLY